MSGPLAGIRVVDLTSVVMGPSATSMLADYDADVIKIEPPEGDVMRHSEPMRNSDMGHYYLSLGANKRSVVLDLKAPAGRDALLRIVKTADVVVYNIRPQAMSRLELDYEALRAVNPQLIYVGAFGFSQRGPYKSRPAYDDLIQGMSGLPWLSMRAGNDEPQYIPMAMVDRVIGLHLFGTITSALVHRMKTGQGQRVDVPMFESMVSFVLAEHMAGERFQPPIGEVGYPRSLSRNRRPFRTRDGHICVLVYNDKQWRKFFELIGRSEVFESDVRFQTQRQRIANIDYVYGYLAEVLETRETGTWMRLFESADIPAANMYSIDDILSDQHLNAIGFFGQIHHPTEGTLRTMRCTTEWSESQPQDCRPAPGLGEHTREVLQSVGFSQDEVSDLVETGVAGQRAARNGVVA